MTGQIVTVFGGSGFLGRYVVRRLAKKGWRVRVAVRRPNEALFVKPYGSVGQVVIVQANIRDEASTRAAILGSDAVVNCVGEMFPSGKQSFAAVHVEGAARIARVAAEVGVQRFVQVSALGADANGDSIYARSKAEGELAVAAAFPNAVIMRPSVMFGTEDTFFNRLGSMAALLPIVPMVGSQTRFQPVYVDDVAAAIAVAIDTGAKAGTYELGGPEVATMRQLVERLLDIIQRRRLLVPLPFWVAGIDAWFLDLAQFLTGGLFTNRILTKDQVRLLRADNVVSAGAKGLEAFGVVPTAMDAVIEGYLTRFRPHGQFDSITASAKNLRS
jgi:uncharacterized protein YbjT (DUF2867 family)